jgi:Undecaprenyl-phosphate glucose phosphotransferase
MSAQPAHPFSVASASSVAPGRPAGPLVPASLPGRRIRLAEDLAAIPARTGLSPSVFAQTYGGLESLALMGAALAAWSASEGSWGALAATGGSAGLTCAMLWLGGAYKIAELLDPVRGLRRALGAWVIVAAAAMSFLMLAMPSPVVAIPVILAGSAALAAGRTGVAWLARRLRRRGRLELLTAIVGSGPRAEGLIGDLDGAQEEGVRVCGVFDDRGHDRTGDLVGMHPKLGSLDDLVDYVRRVRLDLVIVCLPIAAESRVLDIADRLSVLPVDIAIAAGDGRLALSPRSFVQLGPVSLLRLIDKPIAGWNFVLKALFDRVFGALLLVGMAPVMLAVALAVKLDSRGPVLFRQLRYGFNNELIEVFKFRSMYTAMEDVHAARLVRRDDPRVTRVGRIIRRTSLDELPQLLNVVFKGNLSLVGPRPHALQAKAADRLYGEIVDRYFARHRVKPGMTGWAQINGWRGETDTEDKIRRRVEHDLYYIANWSPLLDLAILLRTPLCLTSRENAY